MFHSHYSHLLKSINHVFHPPMYLLYTVCHIVCLDSSLEVSIKSSIKSIIKYTGRERRVYICFFGTIQREMQL